MSRLQFGNRAFLPPRPCAGLRMHGKPRRGRARSMRRSGSVCMGSSTAASPTPGNIAGKQDAGGHADRRMTLRYAHDLPVVPPPIRPKPTGTE